MTNFEPMKRTLLYLLLLPGLLSGPCLLAAGPAGNAGHGAKPCPVSYTHLTLPTKLEV